MGSKYPELVNDCVAKIDAFLDTCDMCLTKEYDIQRNVDFVLHGVSSILTGVHKKNIIFYLKEGSGIGAAAFGYGKCEQDADNVVCTNVTIIINPICCKMGINALLSGHRNPIFELFVDITKSIF